MEQTGPLTIQAARSGAISLQKKYTQSTKRRECPGIFIIFSFVKAPSHPSGPHRIKLPHAVRPYPFPKGIVFVSGEAHQWQEAFDKTSLTLTAISISSLSKTYSSHEAQDKLFKSADYFFFLKSVADRLSKKLENKFFSRNRQPTQVDLDITNPEQIENEIKDAVECAQFYVRSADECWIRAGAFNLSFDNLAENLKTCVDQAWGIIPKAKARVSAISLFTSGVRMPPIWEKKEHHKKHSKEEGFPATEDHIGDEE